MTLKDWARRLSIRCAQLLAPKPIPRNPQQTAEINILRDLVGSREHLQSEFYADNLERAAELIEARQMCGAGPWTSQELAKALEEPGPTSAKVRESNPIVTQGAYGDIELALQNVEWRREINLSWLEFSRWGIQQIILISRLYYIKNPVIRRLIDIAAIYVFGRGLEVSSTDEDANNVLAEFFERNKKTLGQIALVELEKRKYYDGNLFFAFFADATDTGNVEVRTIDANEIQDIITDPDDTDKQWFFRRSWNQRIFDTANGSVTTKHQEAWYPALGYNPATRDPTINQLDVIWDTPIMHRKCGAVAKWNFGCPIIYPALDWAKAATKFLSACLTVKKALSNIAMSITTKGGQQAIEGIKQQLMTTVGPQAPLWDSNPPPVTGATIVSGPGTNYSILNSTGAGGDPEEVRRYFLMCCIVVGVPETFLADVSTGNLATATTLDRPTELVFLEKQEAWREDLTTIAKYVLQVSAGAPSGKFAAALRARGVSDPGKVVIQERRRVVDTRGDFRYQYQTDREQLETREAAMKKKAAPIQITVTFPSIREGDMVQTIQAISQALTLGNKGGQVTGVDEKAGILMMLRVLGVPDPEELIEEMYPDSEYEPDRTKEEMAAPIIQPLPAGTPQTTGGPSKVPPSTQPYGDNQDPTTKSTKTAQESVFAVAGRLEKIGAALLERNGKAPKPRT